MNATTNREGTMRRTFKILEDFLFLAIFVVVAALVTLSVYTGDDAYPLVSATSVVTSAHDRGTVGPELEFAPAPAQNIAATPVTPAVASASPIASGNTAPNR